MTASLLLVGGVMVAVPDPVAAAINPADFQQVELARGVAETGEPISLAVLPDNSVLHTDRRGVLRRTVLDYGTGYFSGDANTQPRHRRAEHHTAASGVVKIAKAAAEGGLAAGDIHNGDWISFSPFAFGSATAFTARVSSAGAGGTLQIRAGSATGTVLGSAPVPVTGGWATFTTVSAPLTGNAGGPLHLVYTGSGTGALFDVDAFMLAAGGIGPVRGLAAKCLDISNGGTADGTKVQLWMCNTTAAQSWTREGLILRALGKCLDVSGGGTADGTQIHLWTCGGGGNQNWSLP